MIKHTGRWNPARGDAHWSRTHPERMARGDAHFSRLHPERLARGGANGSTKHLSPDTVTRAELLLSRTSLTQAEIAAKLGCSRPLISTINLGRHYSQDSLMYIFPIRSPRGKATE